MHLGAEFVILAREIVHYWGLQGLDKRWRIGSSGCLLWFGAVIVVVAGVRSRTKSSSDMGIREFRSILSRSGCVLPDLRLWVVFSLDLVDWLEVALVLGRRCGLSLPGQGVLLESRWLGGDGWVCIRWCLGKGWGSWDLG